MHVRAMQIARLVEKRNVTKDSTRLAVTGLLWENDEFGGLDPTSLGDRIE